MTIMRRRKKNIRKDTFSKTGNARKKFQRAAESVKKKEMRLPSLLEQEILAYLFQKKEPQTMANITEALSHARFDRKMLSNLLADMCRRNMISCPSARKTGEFFTLVKDSDLVEGIVEVHPRGFGFAILGETSGAPAQKPARLYARTRLLHRTIWEAPIRATGFSSG